MSRSGAGWSGSVRRVLAGAAFATCCTAALSQPGWHTPAPCPRWVEVGPERVRIREGESPTVEREGLRLTLESVARDREGVWVTVALESRG
jgi:hypothetical protein